MTALLLCRVWLVACLGLFAVCALAPVWWKR